MSKPNRKCSDCGHEWRSATTTVISTCPKCHSSGYNPLTDEDRKAVALYFETGQKTGYLKGLTV